MRDAKTVGFSIGKISYKDNIGKDMVLKIFIAGNEISEGDMVPKKSKILKEVKKNYHIKNEKMVDQMMKIGQKVVLTNTDLNQSYNGTITSIDDNLHFVIKFNVSIPSIQKVRETQSVAIP